MADNLPDVVENILLDALLRGGAVTGLGTTTTIKAKLMTANGSDSAAGTELGTSGGYTAGGATITFGSAAASGSISNTVAVTWTNMPATTIVGLELWSTGSAIRLWYGALSASKTTASGDTFEFAIGAVTCTIA
jgi:hypothetical protein